MVDLSTILQLIQAAGIIVGVAYYIMNIENNRRNQELTLKAQEHALETRQAQLFMSIYQSIYTTEGLRSEYNMPKTTLKTYEELERLYQEEDAYKAWSWYGTFYEGIGVLVKEDLVDIGHVALLISGGVINFWEKYRELYLDTRSKMNWPRFGVETEYLYDRVIEYGEANPGLQIQSPKTTIPKPENR
ncbi:hypothetical protein JXL21_06745 [Candidatus Bathyarchaeota archaeon]|nr:hypothetical protein [Candidatus Bathyarchaeota archaeon]